MPTPKRPSIKDEGTYDALREDGHSKEAAARIANAQANPEMNPSKKGGEAAPYEEWTKDELLERGAELDVTGRWDMSKEDLIAALRDR